MARVTTCDGYALQAEAHGRGIPLILSCGLCTTLEHWRGQVEPFVRAGLRVILWDYRGHGRSDAPDDPDAYSLELLLDDLERVLDWAAPGESAVLGGLSFGGLASLHMALARPERVRALVLAATGPGFKQSEAQARWAATMEKTAGLIERRGMQALLVRAMAETVIGLRPELPAARAAARAIAAQDPRGVAHFIRRLGAPARSVVDRLGDIGHPVLVVVGALDGAFLRAADLMQARLPRVERSTIADAGHIVNIEQADAFDATVLAFLEKLEREPS
jgi:pimeloyl-ACP methyl ester carboxylesterase